jgi:CHASE3 domain sensor protein
LPDHVPTLQISSTKRRLISLGVIVPTLFVAIPVITANYVQRGLQESQRWVEHTRDVELTIQHVLGGLLDAETGQRGYLAAGQKEFLEPFKTGVQEFSIRFDQLCTLTADNPRQVANAAKLRPVINDKLAFMHRRQEFIDAGDLEAARRLTATGDGRRAMDTIRSLLTKMALEEERLLAQRQTSLEKQARRARLLLWGLVACSAACATAVLWLLNRLGNVQELVKMCAWSQTIEYQGEWVSFSEYLARKFNIDTTHGISPDEVAKVRIMRGAPQRAA